ncbi:MAG: alpha/beta hydrolase [Bacteroidales bacterium]
MQFQNFKNIHFIQTGKGPGTILFLHGNSLSSETFRYQLNEKALQKYNLIAIDFPGHGKSKWSDNKAQDYSLFGFRDVVIDVIQHYNIEEFIFAGHSLGGHVAIECLPFVENCRGIMIWGTPPIKSPLDTSKIFMPIPELGLLFKPELSGEEIDKLGEIYSSQKNSDLFKEAVKLADPQFRSYLPQSLTAGKLSDEVAILEASNVPVAILKGISDKVVNPEYLNSLKLPNLWKNNIIEIKNSGHSIQLEIPKDFNEKLIEFANYYL